MEGCHLLKVESGDCNHIHGERVERMWLGRLHPKAQFLGQSLGSTWETPSQRIDTISIKTEFGDKESFCFNQTALW